MGDVVQWSANAVMATVVPERLGIGKEDPRFNLDRRDRLCRILREAKRILKLSEEERSAVIALCAKIEANTKKQRG